MEDVLGLIILIVIGVVSSIGSSKKKNAKNTSFPKKPVIPYADPKAVPQPAQPAVSHDALRMQREAQLKKDMQAARDAAQEKRMQPAADNKQAQPHVHASVKVQAAPRVHAAVHAAVQERSPEGVDPCHDGFYDEEEPVSILSGQPAPLEAMEGVDPCHDALYETDEEEPKVWTRPTNAAAQELLRGVIWSEVLARPGGRWRTQHR